MPSGCSIPETLSTGRHGVAIQTGHVEGSCSIRTNGHRAAGRKCIPPGCHAGAAPCYQKHSGFCSPATFPKSLDTHPMLLRRPWHASRRQTCPLSCCKRNPGSTLVVQSAISSNNEDENNRAQAPVRGAQAGIGTDRPKNSHPLDGAVYQLTLSIGREKNTWMPPAWAASGLRLEIPILVQFSYASSSASPGPHAGGQGILRVLKVGAYADLSLSDGQWAMDGETLRFWVELKSPLERKDVTLPSGKLYFAVPAWGGQLSRDKGILSIKQRRFVVRLESRMVGRFRAQPLEEGDGMGQGGGVQGSDLPVSRVRQGGLDGPIYN